MWDRGQQSMPSRWERRKRSKRAVWCHTPDSRHRTALSGTPDPSPPLPTWYACGVCAGNSGLLLLTTTRSTTSPYMRPLYGVDAVSISHMMMPKLVEGSGYNKGGERVQMRQWVLQAHVLAAIGDYVPGNHTRAPMQTRRASGRRGESVDIAGKEIAAGRCAVAGRRYGMVNPHLYTSPASVSLPLRSSSGCGLGQRRTSAVITLINVNGPHNEQSSQQDVLPWHAVLAMRRIARTWPTVSWQGPPTHGHVRDGSHCLGRVVGLALLQGAAEAEVRHLQQDATHGSAQGIPKASNPWVRLWQSVRGAMLTTCPPRSDAVLHHHCGMFNCQQRVTTACPWRVGVNTCCWQVPLPRPCRVRTLASMSSGSGRQASMALLHMLFSEDREVVGSEVEMAEEGSCGSTDESQELLADASSTLASLRSGGAGHRGGLDWSMMCTVTGNGPVGGVAAVGTEG